MEELFDELKLYTQRNNLDNEFLGIYPNGCCVLYVHGKFILCLETWDTFEEAIEWLKSH